MRSIYRTPSHRWLVLIAVMLALPAFILASLPGQFERVVIQSVQAARLQSSASCQELLGNGDLETSGGWTFPATPVQGGIVNAPVHAGANAIRLGIATTSNATAYSTAYQSITLPANAQQIVLTYWERSGATGDSGDFRDAILFHPNFTVLRNLDHQVGAGNDQWSQRSFDLSDLAGQSLIVYFDVYNNGSGATLVNYLDDISVQSCDSTATATSTPTPTATTTVTATPTQVVTATPTLTSTPVPAGVRITVGNVVAAQGENQVQVPLNLIAAGNQPGVGALSLAIHYDAARITAKSCTTSEQFDLLLCNVAMPGAVQLAGVAAEGIRSNVRLADIAFELLESDGLSSELTVQLKQVTDPAGDVLNASTDNGQIISACPPGSGSCSNVYLPLVQK
ncbi:MAG: hypothetical protein U0175_26455 [Caldilineaceae bacterium]